MKEYMVLVGTQDEIIVDIEKRRFCIYRPEEALNFMATEGWELHSSLSSRGDTSKLVFVREKK